jgi:hypothetical protein
MNDTQITSLEAYAKEVHPTLHPRQALVLQYLQSAGPHTNCEISAALQKPINTITPRIKELRTQGLVLPAGKRQCTITGRTAWAWRAKHPVLPPAFETEAGKPIQTNSLGI